MRRFFAAAAAVCAFTAVPAHAAIEWCSIYQAMSGNPRATEQIERFSNIGCAVGSAESAHFRAWHCDMSDGSRASLYVISEVGAPSNGAAFVEGDHASLQDAARCMGETQPTISTFTPESIAYRDRARFLDRRTYTSTDLHHLSYLVENVVMSAFSSVGLEGAEEMIFGYKRADYLTGSVEIAGKNILRSTYDDIVEALIGRGSTVLSVEEEESPKAFVTTKMTSPIGLQGVKELKIAHSGQHVIYAEYVMDGIGNYTTMLRAMEGKYGPSVPSKNGGCAIDGFKSEGSSMLYGEKCGGELVFRLSNAALISQASAAAKAMKQRYQTASEPAKPKKPSIDSDNF